MDGHTALRWIEPILGVPLMLVVLADVFLTVLYARMGTAILRGVTEVTEPFKRVTL